MPGEGSAQEPEILPPDVLLREVGLRDGLQMVARYPDTAAKVAWLRAEHAAGIRDVEVGSFLPATAAPQFADVLDIVAAARALPGLRVAGLALNGIGAERALAAGIDEVGFVVSASEAHNLRNVRRTRDQSVEALRGVVAARDARGSPARVCVGIAMAFGCSIAGAVAPGEVVALAERLCEAGADEVSLADTVGHAGPRDVRRLIAETRRAIGSRLAGIHLHDTRGLGLANAAAALDEGIRRLDGSLGGLGGCPFAPNAAGNVVMEDLAFLCETMGLRTGIDLAALVAVREVVAAGMPGETLHGSLARAGLPLGWPGA